MSDEKKKPTVYSELYPGRFLHADNFKGRHVTLTVKDVDLEELEGEKGVEVKAVVSFKETPLLYVLPKICGQALKAMFGPNVRDWVDKRVTFFPTADYAPMKKGEACIRVYGSPDLADDAEITIAMKRRKPFKMVLHAVKARPAGPAAAPAQAPNDPDPYAGRMP